MKLQLSWYVAALFVPLTGCTSSRSASSYLDSIALLSDQQFEIYFLDFGNDGSLLSEEVAARAKTDLATGDFGRVVVLSLGWSYESQTARPEYFSLIESYLSHLRNQPPTVGSTNRDSRSKTAVLCVVWPAAARGVQRFLSDFLPGQSLPRLLGYVPDGVLFPLTFWSKANLASSIGFESLAESLAGIVAGTEATELHMIGHSFGCRILVGLYSRIQESKKQARAYEDLNLAGADEYAGKDAAIAAMSHRLQSVLLIQPALSALDLVTALGSSVEMPDAKIVVTYTHYDHANGFLYPVANAVFPTFVATGMNEAIHSTPSGIRGYADLIAIPGTALNALVISPLSYASGVTHQLLRTHVNIVPNTLAQLPVVEIPVALLDTLIDRFSDENEHWGDRNKGVADFGLVIDSIGSVPDGDFVWSPTRYSLADVIEGHGPADMPGVYMVDVSSAMHHGSMLFGLLEYDMAHPLLDWTLSWLDPVGAHSDYRRPDVYSLIRWSLEGY